MRGKLKLIVCLFILTLVSMSNCRAVDLSATEIINIDGRVEVKKGQGEAFKKLNKNLKLSGSLKRLDGGDKVRTFSKSSAEMALKETCILAVKEQSLFEVPQTLGQDAMTQLKAQQGALLFKVISGSNFEVKTADVIAGVKGTLFELDIVDGFNTIIETPDLELGTITQGGTIVNVYRGEVELTHATTGKTRKLGAGESITVLNNAAMVLDKIFQDGFGILQKFEPRTLLQEKFGNEAVELLNVAPQMGAITNFSGVGSINSNIGAPVQRLTSLFKGCSPEFIKKNGFSELGLHNKFLDAGVKLIDEKYHADFSGYRTKTSQFKADSRKFNEVYLGNKTFAACKAWAGAKEIRLEPTQEGLLLNEGNGLFRCLKFNGNNPDLDFIASYQLSQNQHVTSVNVLKGTLFARIPGELEYYKVPAGAVSHLLTPGTNKGQWVKADPRAFESSINSYKFAVSQKFAKERGQVDRKNRRNKIEAGKSLLRGFGF